MLTTPFAVPAQAPRPRVFARIRRWLSRRYAWRGMPASTLDLAALREAKLAGCSSTAPYPFTGFEMEFDLPEPLILTSDDVTGALLAHIDRGFRHAAFPSRPMPAREWWDELARLASAVRQ
jgi:hypothetical protein